jgi:hypothetical protein
MNERVNNANDLAALLPGQKVYLRLTNRNSREIIFQGDSYFFSRESAKEWLDTDQSLTYQDPVSGSETVYFLPKKFNGGRVDTIHRSMPLFIEIMPYRVY